MSSITNLFSLLFDLYSLIKLCRHLECVGKAMLLAIILGSILKMVEDIGFLISPLPEEGKQHNFTNLEISLGVVLNSLKFLTAALYVYFIYEMRKVMIWLSSTDQLILQIRLRRL